MASDDIAISVRGLGKSYTIAHQKTGMRSLGEAIYARFRRPFEEREGHETFWALKDVDFDVHRGEVLGIIGRNGAGKSTLLKILSRITAPTTGEIDIYGRVASLLEVGTGFHPELTGRENIYMNGTILGMSRSEIKKQFDAIVDFSGVERFLDTPVKRYSSGMYVRLAFAVASTLEPEILIVDEVLAVGDAAFQKKCLGRLETVASEGRTVLFVSHNMQAISSLTTNCLFFADGQLSLDGTTEQAVREYVEFGAAPGGPTHQYLAENSAVDGVLEARVLTSSRSGVHFWGEPLVFEFLLQVNEFKDSLCFSFQVVDELGRPIAYFWQFDGNFLFGRDKRRVRVRCVVPKPRIYMGRYSLSTWFTERRGNHLYENLIGICCFDISMDTYPREEYDWAPGACAYLDDATWQVVESAG